MDTPALKCPRSGRLLTPLSMDYWKLKKKIDRILSDSSLSEERGSEDETPLKRPLDRRKKILASRNETPVAPPLPLSSASSRGPVFDAPKENVNPSTADVKSRRSSAEAESSSGSATKPADSEDSEDIVLPIRRRRRAQKFLSTSSSESEEQENARSSGPPRDETEELSKVLFSTRIGSSSSPSPRSDARTHRVIQISSDDDDLPSLDARVKATGKTPPLKKCNLQNRPKPPATEPRKRTERGTNRTLVPPPSAPSKRTLKARANSQPEVQDDESDFDELLEKLRNRKHQDDVYDESQVDLNNTVNEWEKSNADERRFLESLDEEKVPLTSCHEDALRYRKGKFNAIKDDLAAKLFDLYHGSVFQSRFDSEIPISWNVHMTKTAGFCYYRRYQNGSRGARIELSPKVVDRTSRLRDTLLHEMCHAGAWLVHGYREGHGVLFKFWGQRAHQLLGLEVTTCHTYVIEAKYIYKCQGCAAEVRRHSKSLDTSRFICSICKGRFVLFVNDKRTNQRTPASERKPSAFSKFVKDEYKVIKAKNPHLKHGEVMSALSERWKTAKSNA